MHFNVLEKQEQAKLKCMKQQEIMKLRTAINEIESIWAMHRLNGVKILFLEKKNKSYRPLAN